MADFGDLKFKVLSQLEEITDKDDLDNLDLFEVSDRMSGGSYKSKSIKWDTIKEKFQEQASGAVSELKLKLEDDSADDVPDGKLRVQLYDKGFDSENFINEGIVDNLNADSVDGEQKIQIKTGGIDFQNTNKGSDAGLSLRLKNENGDWITSEHTINNLDADTVDGEQKDAIKTGGLAVDNSNQNLTITINDVNGNELASNLEIDNLDADTLDTEQKDAIKTGGLAVDNSNQNLTITINDVNGNELAKNSEIANLDAATLNNSGEGDTEDGSGINADLVDGKHANDLSAFDKIITSENVSDFKTIIEDPSIVSVYIKTKVQFDQSVNIKSDSGQKLIRGEGLTESGNSESEIRFLDKNAYFSVDGDNNLSVVFENITMTDEESDQSYFINLTQGSDNTKTKFGFHNCYLKGAQNSDQENLSYVINGSGNINSPHRIDSIVFSHCFFDNYDVNQLDDNNDGNWKSLCPCITTKHSPDYDYYDYDTDRNYSWYNSQIFGATGKNLGGETKRDYLHIVENSVNDADTLDGKHDGDVDADTVDNYHISDDINDGEVLKKENGSQNIVGFNIIQNSYKANKYVLNIGRAPIEAPILRDTTLESSSGLGLHLSFRNDVLHVLPEGGNDRELTRIQHDWNNSSHNKDDHIGGMRYRLRRGSQFSELNINGGSGLPKIQSTSSKPLNIPSNTVSAGITTDSDKDGVEWGRDSHMASSEYNICYISRHLGSGEDYFQLVLPYTWVENEILEVFCEFHGHSTDIDRFLTIGSKEVEDAFGIPSKGYNDQGGSLWDTDTTDPVWTDGITTTDSHGFVINHGIQKGHVLMLNLSTGHFLIALCPDEDQTVNGETGVEALQDLENLLLSYV